MRSITNYSVQVVCTVFTQRLCLQSLHGDSGEAFAETQPEEETKKTDSNLDNNVAMADVNGDQKTSNLDTNFENNVAMIDQKTKM